MFCSTDNTPVCTLCYLVGTHKGHTVISLAEAATAVRTRVGEELKDAKELQSMLNVQQGVIAGLIATTQKTTVQAVVDIQTRVAEIQTALQNRQKELIMLVASRNKNSMIDLSAREATTANLAANADNLITVPDTHKLDSYSVILN